jgi:transposase
LSFVALANTDDDLMDYTAEAILMGSAFEQLFGIPVTRGACAQIVLRAGQRLEPAYQDILEQLKASPHITPDETGWRVGGHPAWLHVGVGEQATAYFIDPHRSADALERALGIDWEGIFTHDGWSSYDRFLEAIHQRCLNHPLARARRLLDIQVGAARRFPQQVIDLIQESLTVRDRFLAGGLSEARLYRAHEDFTLRLLDLCDHPRVNALNQRLANHLALHGEQWFLFLIDPSIPATNYLAEQALRPAVVNRKVWGGNRTWAGARAQMVITSVLQTCNQHTQSAFRYLSETLRHLAAPLFTFLQPALA